jgi:ubiquitin-protein ligase
MSEWWGSRQQVAPRLRVEVEAMRAAFQDTFKLVVPQLGGPIYWLGTIEINMVSAYMKQREHVLKILYPDDFPNRPPEAYVVRPKLYSEKHQFEDGQLCLFNPKDGTSYGWNPTKGTAVTVAAWGIQWIYAHYTWKATGVWPGEEERIAR